MKPTPWLTERHGYDPTLQEMGMNVKHPALPHQQVGGQAVLGRQHLKPTPWFTERHGEGPGFRGKGET